MKDAEIQFIKMPFLHVLIIYCPISTISNFQCIMCFFYSKFWNYKKIWVAAVSTVDKQWARVFRLFLISFLLRCGALQSPSKL